ncbi:ABC transporter ATP-binding protein [Enterococcus avium]|uniref:ABC transporter ATP-binding protein n=1 Tax=Enterococcus malodoratus TaxID=71451 RepID=UPI0008D27ADC|nr:ABC transporter ATP-binding protein [Enterococcus malodoratus]BBM19835.1 ABC transporter ATP-binding protein [Enterococcus avium]SET94541.1 ABC-type lipoprotein export system, ATPase component [Enterococcus malodoratus]
MEPVIKATAITKKYAQQEVLKGIDIAIAPGDFTCIMGRSGCGKTTLLKILGLMHPPTAGEIFFEDKLTHDLFPDEISDIRRRKIGFVFQDFNLMESITVGENILLPAILDKQDPAEAEEKMKPFFQVLRIEHLLDKLPHELSVGEKQRAAICRALINAPEIILADEPTGNLDSNAGAEVIKIFQRINQELGITIVMITHDSKVAQAAKEVIFLKDGQIYDRLVNVIGSEAQIAEKMLEV